MTVEAQTCPYCNALTPASSPDALGRATCPRCGESFAARPTTTAVTPTPAGLPPTARFPSVNGAEPARLLVAAPPSWPARLGALSGTLLAFSLLLRVALGSYAPAEKGFPFMFGLGCLGLVAAVWLWYFHRRRSNQAVVWFVLGNMLVMVGVAVPFALLTRDARRSHDPKQLEQEEELLPLRHVNRPVAPAQLPALGYLPRDTKILAAIHVRELLQEKDGRDFLEPGGWVPVELALGQVKKWTGLPPEAIDQVVVGLRAGKLPVPQSFFVVQTRQPYDLKAFAKELTAGRKDQLHQHPLYFFQPGKLQGFLWCPSERTFVLGVVPDLANADEVKALLLTLLPARPYAGVDGLPEALRQCVRQRLPRGTLLWLAGHKVPPLWNLVIPFKAIKGLPRDLDKVNTFHLDVRFQKGVALVGEFQCADDAAAQRLQQFLAKQDFSGLEAKVAGTLPAALTWATVAGWGPEPVATPGVLLAALRHQERQARDAAEHWVSMQVRGSTERLRQALRR